MPKQDKTGPMGQGSRTGWGMGPCGGGMGFGKGSGRGFGRGFGRFWRFGSQVTQGEEKEALKEEVKSLEEELTAVKTRLAELKD